MTSVARPEHAANDGVHTRSTTLEPGLYPTDPQGHTLIVGSDGDGQQRSLAVLNMDGLIDIGGIKVRDPDVLDRLADRLHANAASLRHELAHPYRPGLPGVPGCPICGHRAN